MSNAAVVCEMPNSGTQGESAPTPGDVVRRYGQAKSRQDLGAALACCTADFVLETTAWGTRACGRAEAAFDLRVFFELFPDYTFAFESIVAQGDRVVAVGRARFTWTGRLPSFVIGSRFLRRKPREIDVPAIAVFEVRDGKLARERFTFDEADVARQMRVPAALVRWVMRKVVEQRHRVTGSRAVAPVECTRSTLIEADASAVYARAIEDVTALMHSVPPVPWLRPVSIELVGSRMETGAVRRVTLRNGQITHELVHDCKPGSHLHYRITDGWGRSLDWLVAETYGEHWVEPHEGFTRLAWRGNVVARRAWLRPLVRLLMPLLVGTMQRRYLAAMRRELET